MKKLSYLFVLFTILISCSKDDSITTPDDNGSNNDGDGGVEFVLPIITLESGEDGTYHGVIGSPTNGSLQHQIKAIAADGFVSLEIFKVLDGTSSAYEEIDTNHQDYISGSNLFFYQLNYILNNDEAGKDLHFNAVVTDANDHTFSFDFAVAEIRFPMIKTTISLQTVVPPNGDITIPYYLLIDGDNVSAENHTTAVHVEFDQNIALVFSVNDGSGFYFASPTAVVETVIVNGMQEKANTKFKEHVNGSPFNNPLDTSFNIYDNYELDHRFSVLDYNSNEGKAEQAGIVGKRYYFLTDNGKTGVIQTTNLSMEGSNAFIEFDLFVNQ